MTTKSTKALGPYNRYVIWVQGCQKRCHGCISPDSQPIDGGYEEDVDVIVADVIKTPDIEGITISGGEPFLQVEPLVYLIKKIKLTKDIGVIVYTGMLFQEIEESELKKVSDIIIDGEYQDELNDDLSLRGSSNQNIYLITKKYENEANIYGVQGRKIELYVRDGYATMIGIPDKKTCKYLKKKQ